MRKEKLEGISVFEKYLTVWVALCIVIGVAVGQFLPIIPNILNKFEYARVSIPVAILIWVMIYPMMLKIDFSSILHTGKKPKGLILTLTVNWLVKPFSMYLLGWFFLQVAFKNLIPAELSKDYLAGLVILAAAPCTAMVFVWSHLTKGNPAYTLVQVAINDLLILVFFAPIVMFLLKIANVVVPMDTVILSVVLFVVIPLAFGYISRVLIVKRKGLEWFQNVYIKKFDKVTITGLLLTLIILFSFQGKVILSNPFIIALIAVPIIIQTFSMFFLVYFAAKFWKVEHNVAAPAAMIGGSNFFELAVAVAISLFGMTSGAALATVVGVLVEVPVMLALVKFANNTRHWFSEK